ncbi:MAG: hypothetical protein JJ873_15975 [Maricaulis sp.]|uniref:hypothetical protein n=1 Tax=Maricaulis sp. TaxID=1486257 RepID=UPI001B1C2FF5|nr:hypothetical protein [Maricaulis sp.]MBO6696916.1 hypothetical protein [Henriciella sp.]MBO6730852.1 hypothetical protein [Maricaulis sp.]MBO6878883.1 hypothetical protein [Maricaulis sp.]
MKQSTRAFLSGIVIAASGTTMDAEAQASLQDVTQGFIDAVYLYCVPLVVDGIELSEELHPNAPSQIVPASPQRSRNDGGPNWVIDGIGEIVVIEVVEARNMCSVSAYGPPAGQTFQALSNRLQWDDLGFVEIENDTSEPRVSRRRLRLERDGRTFELTMSGNDPGARGTLSRFSTLIAGVREVREKP